MWTLRRVFSTSPFILLMTCLCSFILINMMLLYIVHSNSTSPTDPILHLNIRRSIDNVDPNKIINNYSGLKSHSKFHMNERDLNLELPLYTSKSYFLKSKDTLPSVVEVNQETAMLVTNSNIFEMIEQIEETNKKRHITKQKNIEEDHVILKSVSNSLMTDDYLKKGSYKEGYDYDSVEDIDGRTDEWNETSFENEVYDDIMLPVIDEEIKDDSEEESPGKGYDGEDVEVINDWDQIFSNIFYSKLASPRNPGGKLPVSLEEYRSGQITGNPLIDDYGKNNVKNRGEMGKPVVLTPKEKRQAKVTMSKFNVNTVASDVTPLNRLVPDTRIENCDKLTYVIDHLPTASIIIPFHDEWPSFLLRTVYSIINRSPRPLVEEIILVDDASNLEWLKEPLESYIETHFPLGLVRLIRNKKRLGLIKTRMRGCHKARGDVLIFFDSHMEVNVDWLQPLLVEISRDRTVVAMSSLDYVKAEDLDYEFYNNYLIRYGWNWRLIFYELYFRPDQIDQDPRKPRPGPTMVGAAFAIDKQYFLDLGGYDESMTVWGGENLEMGWRVWLCGGSLLHVPCSRIGHVPRSQPYSFPGGRDRVEHFNYKRAIEVWMGNYTRFVYSIFPDMKTLDVGDLSERQQIKTKLACKDFGWYLENIWPELAIYDQNALSWGQVRNEGTDLCLDNDYDVYQDLVPLRLLTCDRTLDLQAFTLTQEGVLKTSLSCVVCPNAAHNVQVKMEDCITGSRDRWFYTEDNKLVHKSSQLCLDVRGDEPVLRYCSDSSVTQMWIFQPYLF